MTALATAPDEDFALRMAQDTFCHPIFGAVRSPLMPCNLAYGAMELPPFQGKVPESIIVETEKALRQAVSHVPYDLEWKPVRSIELRQDLLFTSWETEKYKYAFVDTGASGVVIVSKPMDFGLTTPESFADAGIAAARELLNIRNAVKDGEEALPQSSPSIRGDFMSMHLHFEADHTKWYQQVRLYSNGRSTMLTFGYRDLKPEPFLSPTIGTAWNPPFRAKLDSTAGGK